MWCADIERSDMLGNCVGEGCAWSQGAAAFPPCEYAAGGTGSMGCSMIGIIWNWPRYPMRLSEAGAAVRKSAVNTDIIHLAGAATHLG